MDLDFELFKLGSQQLLAEFECLSQVADVQRRGYDLQDFLSRLFRLHKITLRKPFIRNEGGEQIDGAFRLDGWYYLVECRWRKKLADIRELDGLTGQVSRSGKQTMGLFLSINGWSEHVPQLLKQNPEKGIILMNGDDLRAVLSEPLNLGGFILDRAETLNFEAEPYSLPPAAQPNGPPAHRPGLIAGGPDLATSSDRDFLALLAELFDRPAFYTPFRHESSMPDFKKALTDTIEALNTGIHRLRDRTEIRRIPTRHQIKDEGIRRALAKIDRQVSHVRARYEEFLQGGQIRPCSCGRPDCAIFFVDDPAVMHEMDDRRQAILDAFRAIYPEFVVSMERW